MKTLTRITLAAWTIAVLCASPRQSAADEKTGISRIFDSSSHDYHPINNEIVYGNGYGHAGCGWGWQGAGISPVTGVPGYPPVSGAVWLPSIHPVQRDPVLYQRYWPDRWYGMPGGGIAPDAFRAPVVYVPTDTTQLGFYHQRVPYWTPRPNAYPGPPNPHLLHNYTRPALDARWYYGSLYWGVPQQIPAGTVAAENPGAPVKKVQPPPKKETRPPIPKKLDGAAAEPLFDLQSR